MKVVIIHGQNHKGSTYHIARMVADLCFPCNWRNEGFSGVLQNVIGMEKPLWQ